MAKFNTCLLFVLMVMPWMFFALSYNLQDLRTGVQCWVSSYYWNTFDSLGIKVASYSIDQHVHNFTYIATYKPTQMG